MLFSGMMNCRDQSEYDSVMGRLKGLPVKVYTEGLDIIAEYIPGDRETDREIEETVARLADIIESVEAHGFTLMTGGG